MTIADFPDWQAPSAHAAQIASQGVPLLTKSQLLANQTFASIAHGASNGTGTLVVTQPGYEIIVNPKFPAGTTNPFVEVNLQWIDSATGNGVANDVWFVPGCTDAHGFVVYGRGPSKADRVSVGITNLDTAQSVTCTVELLVNSRVLPVDVWRFNNTLANSSTVTGFTLPSFPDDPSCLGTVTGASVPATSNLQWLMGIGSGGPVTVTIEASGPVPGSARFHAYALPSSAYGTIAPLIAYTAGNLNQSYTFNPPRAPWLLQAVNSATSGAMTVNFAAFASQ